VRLGADVSATANVGIKPIVNESSENLPGRNGLLISECGGLPEGINS
jgi:hypothetical protein